MSAPAKIYLGDGAYAGTDRARGCIVLTAEDGIRATDTVVLEAEPLIAFLAYLEALGVLDRLGFQRRRVTP